MKQRRAAQAPISVSLAAGYAPQALQKLRRSKRYGVVASRPPPCETRPGIECAWPKRGMETHRRHRTKGRSYGSGRGTFWIAKPLSVGATPTTALCRSSAIWRAKCSRRNDFEAWATASSNCVQPPLVLTRMAISIRPCPHRCEGAMDTLSLCAQPGGDAEPSARSPDGLGPNLLRRTA